MLSCMAGALRSATAYKGEANSNAVEFREDAGLKRRALCRPPRD